MAIRIVYIPGPAPNPKVVTGGPDPILAITWDKWNDYSIRTMFGAFLIVGNAQHHLGEMRLMTSDEGITSDLLDTNGDAPEGGKEFGFGGRLFLALGANLSFYEKLIENLPNPDQREELLLALHDTITLKHRKPAAPDLALCKTDTFRISLLRGSPERQVYRSAREILFPDEMQPERFNFNLTVMNRRFSAPYSIQFDFLPEHSRARPTNITVLIGENGLGKTVTLVSLAKCLTASQPVAIPVLNHSSAQIDKLPPFSSVIAVSYSPFETFPTTIPEPEVGAGRRKYSYCGFRKADGTWGGYEFAWSVAFARLLEIIEYEQSAENLVHGKPKFTHLINVLREGLGFDRILVLIRPDDPEPPQDLAYCVVPTASGERYIDLTLGVQNHPGEISAYLAAAGDRTNLYLAKKEQETPIGRFSAGQAMFVFMSVGAISAIDSESVLIIDEPELYLHPNLIISYLRMLASLLDLFQSFAVVATHSAYVAREVPARNVRIFQAAEANTVSVDPPTIETFGADLIDITNLVFYNTEERKPFEEWLRGLITDETDFGQLKQKYGNILNAENLTFLRYALTERIREREKGERQ